MEAEDRIGTYADRRGSRCSRGRSPQPGGPHRGIAGLIFIALFIASFFTPSTPMATDPPDQIVADLIS